MTDGWLGGDFAREANDRFASAYDDFNHAYRNVQWTERLLAAAEQCGSMTGRRLLDVGCGTGLSFIPMLARGWEVVAYDVSPSMAEAARRKVEGNHHVRVSTLDARDQPVLGEFDLVWAINDAVNYLLSADELQSVLTGMRRNLAPGGIALFDTNTFDTYRTWFAEEHRREHGGRRMVWVGRVNPRQARPGMMAEARFVADGDPDSVHVHRQRHFPESVVRGAIIAAGLRLVAIYGELEGDLDDLLLEDVHSKAVYVCRAALPANEGA